MSDLCNKITGTTLILNYVLTNNTILKPHMGEKETLRVEEREQAFLLLMALASFFTVGPSLLAKTAMAAVNPVSSGPSTIFSLLGQCWHFNYCWVNSFAPMKAMCPNRICRLHDL